MQDNEEQEKFLENESEKAKMEAEIEHELFHFLALSLKTPGSITGTGNDEYLRKDETHKCLSCGNALDANSFISKKVGVNEFLYCSKGCIPDDY